MSKFKAITLVILSTVGLVAVGYWVAKKMDLVD